MNSKKAITLLVLTTMLLAMVPMAPVSADLTNPGITFDNLDHATWTDHGEKGHDIEVKSKSGTVASGYEVLVYWDKIQDWDGEKGHLNTSEPKDDGSIKIWFTVPEADVGGHTLWFTATDQEYKRSEAFTVVSDCDISTSSGLAESKILVDLWGYAKDKEVAILFMDNLNYLTTNPYVKYFGEDAVDLYESGEDKYDGTFEENMIQPGTVFWEIGILDVKGTAIAEWSNAQTKLWSYSAHLKTTGTVGDGDEGRIRVYLPVGTTLADITSISWDYYLVAGYAPHVDIMVDTTGDGTIDDALVVEYAYNDAVGKHLPAGQPTYGCLYNAWYATFSDDGDGPAAVTDTSYAWPTTGPAGPFATVCHTLADWKNSITYGAAKTIDKDTPVLALEFEVDNWMAQTEAYIDNIKLNGDSICPIITDNKYTAKSNGNIWWLNTVPTPDVWVDVGNINYVTGEWSLDLGEVAGIADGEKMDVSYGYIVDEDDHLYVLSSSGKTNSLGTWEDKRVTIPNVPVGSYYVVGFDGKNNQANAKFTIGAVITLSENKGDVGDKITVEGEGFVFGTPTDLHCKLTRGTKTWEAHIIDSENAPLGKDADKPNDKGEFEFDIIIPDTDKKDDDFKIHVYGGSYDAKASFEVTGLASMSLSPEFGPQGSGITVSGENYQNIKDKKIDITLEDKDGWVADIKKGVKVGSDGSFEVDTIVPTENDGLYKIKVAAVKDDDGEFNIYESKEFRIGTIMVLLSKDESVVGDQIVLTGNGFTLTGEWNATFGDITIFKEETCVNGLLKMSGVTPQFFVPQVEPGVYTILVWDVDAEITVETEFTVTEYTVLEFELLEAPNEFSVDIEGWNWPEVDGDFNKEDEIEFVLWNETDDWEMDLDQLWDHDDDPDTKKVVRTDALLNATGFLNDAYWVVPDDKTLDKGTYTVNATIETDNNQEYFMQLEFVIGDVHLGISPRKATFRVGDTVSFDIEHTFGNDKTNIVWGGDLKVYDPDDNLYWDGDELETWSKVDTWYEVPYSAQTASDNPMVLLDDAPLGTWTYKWRENAAGGRDTIVEGTFNVEAGAEEVLEGQIEDLNNAIDDLTSDISSVTEAVAGVQTNINSAIQAANAAVDAANAATEAVNAVAIQSGEAAQAAERAAEAAGKAQDAAGGLTTLVYGAIGASLVAALAAIVSLMQISRRIAG